MMVMRGLKSQDLGSRCIEKTRVPSGMRKQWCRLALFVLRLKVPLNNFFSHVRTEPTLPGFNQYYRELVCLAQGHNTVTPVGIELRTSQFGSPMRYHYASMLHLLCSYYTADVCLCFRLTNITKLKSKLLAILECTVWFVLGMVRNPEDWFS